MDWERIESARTRARFMLAIPWLAIASLAFVEVSAPHGPNPMNPNRPGLMGMPIDTLALAVGASECWSGSSGCGGSTARP